MTIRYSKRALSQLASLYDYLRDRNPAAADDVGASIARTIARLQELPLLGKQTDEADVRVIIDPEYLYRVFYRVERREIMVIRILHQSQV